MEYPILLVPLAHTALTWRLRENHELSCCASMARPTNTTTRCVPFALIDADFSTDYPEYQCRQIIFDAQEGPY